MLRVGSPSLVLSEIHHRLDLVSFFQRNKFVHYDVRDLLRGLDDLSRILQRLFMRRGTAFDILGLKKSMRIAIKMREVLMIRLVEIKSASFISGKEVETVDHELDLGADAVRVILTQLDGHPELVDLIGETIDEEALIRRELDAEKRAGIAETLGTGAAERVMEIDESNSNWTEGLWGKNEEWVIKPK